MGMGTFQRVVKYRVVQKMTWLVGRPLLSQSTTQKTLIYKVNVKINDELKGKVSVRSNRKVTT